MSAVAVPAPYLRAILKYGPLVDGVAHQYGINGRQLLARLTKGESGFNMGAVSSAGARGATQFMPGTRADYIKRFHIDPWASPDQAIHATAIYLKTAHNIGAYNPGMASYTSYILGQHVGNLAKQARQTRVTTASPGTTPNPVTEPGGTGLASLIAQLQNTPTHPSGSLLQAPAYSTDQRQGAGIRAPQMTAPAPQQQSSSLSDLLASMDQQGSQAQTQGPSTPRAPGAGKTPQAVTQVTQLFERAAKIDAERLPYQWGGGHGGTPAKPGVPLDCSGAVSRLLGVSPRVSGQFEQFGQAGRGQHVTIYANGHHVLMEINGHFWGTSATNPGGGAGWIPRGAISQQYLTGFVARHPPGM